MSQPISRERALFIGLAAVAFGSTTILRRLAVSRLHPFQYESVAGAIHACLIPIYLWFIWRDAGIGSWDRAGLLWTVIATIINTAGTLFFLYALKQGNDAGFVSSLAGASPIITVMLSALFLGEHPDIRQAVGIALVLLGVVVASGR